MKTNQSFSSEPRFCEAKINLSINSDDIPTLTPQKKLDVLMENDDNPYFVVEEIEDIRKPANNVIYSPEFWKSYLSKLNKRPIPGSKDGHNISYYKTPNNDIYTIGGKLEKNKVFLKVYIPPEGALTSNKSLIRDLKAGIIHFSIVSWTKDNIELDENGFIQKITAIESVKGERNDAVEYGMGAMDQKVSKKTPGENPDDNKQNKEVKYIMPGEQYNEIIENLKNQLDNGTVSKVNLAKDLNIEIVTEEHKNAVQSVNEMVKIAGKDFTKRVSELIENEGKVEKQNYDNLRETLMTKEFGPVKSNQDGKEIDNLKRQAAEPLVSMVIQSEEELQKQISAAKENAVVKKFSFEAADITSDVNDITGVKVVDKQDKYSSEVVEL